MKNPIERRVDQLTEQWNEFAENPQTRLLRWLVDQDEARMIDVFLEAANHAPDNADVFLRFDDPFGEATRYGFSLRESLIELFKQVQEQDPDLEFPRDWVCPEIKPDDTDITALLRSLGSLRQHYEGRMLHLAVALMPVEIGPPAEWQQWLSRLLQARVPPTVRFLVVDDAGGPVLDELCQQEPERAVTFKPELAMAAAPAEILRTVPGSGPGFTFRRLLVAMTSACAAGNLRAAEGVAAKALAIARQQNWAALQAVVHMALGAGYLAAGDARGAVQTYRQAAQAVQGQDDPAAPKIVVQSKFAEAAVLVGDGQFAAAAAVYQQIPPLAEQQNDHFALLESWRMAAYCHEMNDQPDSAWQCGHKALDVGALLEEDARATSTLPYVGQGLLRLTKQKQYANQAADVRQRMVALVGEDWESQLG